MCIFFTCVTSSKVTRAGRLEECDSVHKHGKDNIMSKFIVHVNNDFDEEDIIEVECETETEARIFAEEELSDWNRGNLDDRGSFRVNYTEVAL